MKFTPSSNHVLIKPLEEEKTTEGGIVIPDTVKEKPTKGTVVAVGPGKKNEDGKLISISVQEGQTVLFRKYGLDEIEIEGEEYVIGTEDSILGILN